MEGVEAERGGRCGTASEGQKVERRGREGREGKLHSEEGEEEEDTMLLLDTGASRATSRGRSKATRQGLNGIGAGSNPLQDFAKRNEETRRDGRAVRLVSAVVCHVFARPPKSTDGPLHILDCLGEASEEAPEETFEPGGCGSSFDEPQPPGVVVHQKMGPGLPRRKLPPAPFSTQGGSWFIRRRIMPCWQKVVSRQHKAVRTQSGRGKGRECGRWKRGECGRWKRGEGGRRKRREQEM